MAAAWSAAGLARTSSYRTRERSGPGRICQWARRRLEGEGNMTSAAKEAMEQQQYLTFILSGEEYAINILRVKEIIGYDTVTTVPQTPPWIRGVLNLRGNVVPVIDLAVRFRLGEEPVTKTSCIIILEWQQQTRDTMMGVVA